MILLADMWLDGWGWLVALASVAFWTLLIVAIVALIRGHPRAPGAPGASTALRVLEDRYARGEISREEFVERRSVLRGDVVLGQGGAASGPGGGRTG